MGLRSNLEIERLGDNQGVFAVALIQMVLVGACLEYLDECIHERRFPDDVVDSPMVKNPGVFLLYVMYMPFLLV